MSTAMDDAAIIVVDLLSWIMNVAVTAMTDAAAIDNTAAAATIDDTIASKAMNAVMSIDDVAAAATIGGGTAAEVIDIDTITAEAAAASKTAAVRG